MNIDFIDVSDRKEHHPVDEPLSPSPPCVRLDHVSDGVQ